MLNLSVAIGSREAFEGIGVVLDISNDVAWSVDLVIGIALQETRRITEQAADVALSKEMAQETVLSGVLRHDAVRRCCKRHMHGAERCVKSQNAKRKASNLEGSSPLLALGQGEEDIHEFLEGFWSQFFRMGLILELRNLFLTALAFSLFFGLLSLAALAL